MRRRLTVTEMARNFADYITRVAYRGERFLLVRGNRPVAEIRPVPEARKLSELVGLLASLPPLTEEEARDFRSDWIKGREEIGGPDAGDAWAS